MAGPQCWLIFFVSFFFWFWWTLVISVGVPLFWISGDACPGLKGQYGHPQPPPPTQAVSLLRRMAVPPQQSQRAVILKARECEQRLDLCDSPVRKSYSWLKPLAQSIIILISISLQTLSGGIEGVHLHGESAIKVIRYCLYCLQKMSNYAIRAPLVRTLVQHCVIVINANSVMIQCSFSWLGYFTSVACVHCLEGCSGMSLVRSCFCLLEPS